MLHSHAQCCSTCTRHIQWSQVLHSRSVTAKIQLGILLSQVPLTASPHTLAVKTVAPVYGKPYGPCLPVAVNNSDEVDSRRAVQRQGCVIANWAQPHPLIQIAMPKCLCLLAQSPRSTPTPYTAVTDAAAGNAKILTDLCSSVASIYSAHYHDKRHDG